jgi:DNA-binding Lrp family transcriptional regulator
MIRAQDAIDRELLALLSTNARMSTSEIARRLQLARSTVNERILRLEKSGVIVGYRAILTPDSDAMQTRAYLQLEVEPAQSRSLVHALSGYPEIQECMTVSGRHTLMCFVTAPCAEDIDALVDELVALDGVRQTEVMIVLCTKFDRHARQDIRTGKHLTLAS